ncbi:hypothetical protein B9Z55_016691 [Caenorhabditis nigoni]|uniref:F-box domain-containing protein n=1 Tax=Caenorhabditis nigoni TaxID=1611254 RepID=A0A2G5T6M4_9PELO|nr:hypothetical protein B9Z55_016691 [Caenorhabditis nigoni]
MPINLLKIPDLIGALVVSELEYSEIFLLSICSHRSNILVKKAGIKVPKLEFRYEDSRVRYKIFEIGVVTDIQEWLPITSVLHVKKLDLKKIFTVKLGHGQQADTNFYLWREENGTFINRIKCAIEPMTVQKALQNHINSIFHYSDSNQLILSRKREKSLPNITNVKEMRIDYVTVDPQFLTNVLTTYPDIHTISVFSEIVGDVPNNSPFFQISNFFAGYPCGPDYLHNFFGRNLYLGNATFTEQDLIQFLQKWISNEAYYNLETLTLETENAINGDLIRQTIEFEEYDPNEPEKRPDIFFVDIPLFGFTPQHYHLRDRRFVEIRRITDGKRAFLAVDLFDFNFLVQKN